MNEANDPSPHPPLPLVDVLLLQREAWEKGQRPLVEELLREHPHLRESRDACLDLIYSEIVLREQIGEQGKLEEYLARFPHLEADLRLQFEVDEALTVDPETPPSDNTIL